uniref:Uncharacterized protein n=1 Tax=Chromera velia CCMP2878 TaxID=1169474 RepID=A0A0G4IF55_9ALVE|eukprot:Cvel_13820.t1-p1 / transcript=Cvel_13820.t1 / gene=Cvel_13820 / organism=Chromera_velia_CCMP2878 / gene_product=hypothetical protein / transcript_product=hypothetical protein / location=Cvel_scaffold959:31395-32354(+) / protein_length=320 / sequence_SO=supercontig / SO=protein_coding / is_pseudo=false
MTATVFSRRNLLSAVSALAVLLPNTALAACDSSAVVCLQGSDLALFLWNPNGCLCLKGPASPASLLSIDLELTEGPEDNQSLLSSGEMATLEDQISSLETEIADAWHQKIEQTLSSPSCPSAPKLISASAPSSQVLSELTTASSQCFTDPTSTLAVGLTKDDASFQLCCLPEQSARDLRTRLPLATSASTSRVLNTLVTLQRRLLDSTFSRLSVPVAGEAVQEEENAPKGKGEKLDDADSFGGKLKDLASSLSALKLGEKGAPGDLEGTLKNLFGGLGDNSKPGTGGGLKGIDLGFDFDLDMLKEGMGEPLKALFEAGSK